MIATIIQIAGFLTLSVGVGMFSIPAGLIVLGAGIVAFGIAYERGH